ncbi:hypothetical protein O7635_06875 [Asanoa sp. WMMD1127]|uniref:type II secretion system F family protein n=1 Tax=Asanoa sp. WMMD1127 TaxID=3016107 RepID=UPI002415C1C3|nr:hypothetical protein [Asanoa sp. WMMD1127]MDG4821577.1 hypothetical protein [Asanoa sp. WMMD1127]
MTIAILGGVALSLVAVLLVVVRRSRRLRRRQLAVLSASRSASRPASVRRRHALASRLAAMILAGPRWRALSLSFGLAALPGWFVGGVVAAIGLGAYGAVAVSFIRERRGEAARRAERSAQLDRLTGLAADLRAGLPVQAAAQAASIIATDPAAGASAASAPHGVNLALITDPAPSRSDAASARRGVDLAELAAAAVTLAERTGAPLADLIDRIEADARAGDRARAAALAQTAGTQATAVLLAALPIGGLAMGYAIGTNPLEMLLHTPLGAVCAFGAIGLQILGLLWSQRLQPRPS